MSPTAFTERFRGPSFKNMTGVHGFHIFGQALLVWTCLLKICWSEENTTLGTDYQSGDDDNFSTSSFDYSNVVFECGMDRYRTFRAWFLPAIYSLICLVAVVGNFLVILTYIYFKRLKTMTDVYLLSLAIADLLLALSLPFWAASIVSTWKLGLFPCRAMYTIYKVSFFSGMFLLTCISVDRYYSIAKAVTAHRCRANAVYYSKVSSLVAWMMALLFSIPEMVYSNINSNGTCVSYGTVFQKEKTIMQVVQMVLGFGLPAVVMGFCYCSIIRTLAQARNFEKNKALKVIFAVVAVFTLSQLPYNLVLGLSTRENTNCDYENKLFYAVDITQGLAFVRCCVNPFLYAFIGVKFRNDLLKLMKEMGCLGQHRFLYASYGKRKSSAGLDTETTTSFSP